MRPAVHQLLVIISALVFATFALFFGSLVKQVSAGCSGTIYCGAMRNLCSISHASCTRVGDLCGFAGSGGTCTWMCDETQGPMSCAGISSQWTCEQLGVKDCATHCSINADRPCSWGGVGGPTPTPGVDYSVVNCGNLFISGGSTTLIQNQTYTVSADFGFPYSWGCGGERVCTAQILTNQTACSTHAEQTATTSIGWTTNISPAGNHSYSYSWTPTAIGTYKLYCGTSVATMGSCRGTCSVTDWLEYTCGGPGAYVTVNVVDLPPSCSVGGPTQVCAGASASYNVTSANASSGSEIWKSPTANQSWTNIRPPGGDCRSWPPGRARSRSQRKHPPGFIPETRQTHGETIDGVWQVANGN